MLDPAHILVGTRGKHIAMANKFADWVMARDGGQEITKELMVNGTILYSVAPDTKQDQGIKLQQKLIVFELVGIEAR